MTVRELIERLHEFDGDLEVRFLNTSYDAYVEDTADEVTFADLPAHESYVLLHDHDMVESHELWKEAEPT